MGMELRGFLLLDAHKERITRLGIFKGSPWGSYGQGESLLMQFCYQSTWGQGVCWEHRPSCGCAGILPGWGQIPASWSGTWEGDLQRDLLLDGQGAAAQRLPVSPGKLEQYL